VYIGLHRIWLDGALPPVFHALRRLGLINFSAGPRLSLSVPTNERGRAAPPLRVAVGIGGERGQKTLCLFRRRRCAWSSSARASPA